MRISKYLASLTITLLVGCTDKNAATLSSFEVFCEMVANDAKPIALSQPMEMNELEHFWDDFQMIATKYQVSLYREIEFPVTSLFPKAVTEGKEVVLIYRAPRLTQYHQLKKDVANLQPEEAARRFGRLLGYTSQGINELLAKNTDFRTLASYGVHQQITHLYYQDVEEAYTFYEDILGLTYEEDIGFKISSGASIQLHAVNEEHPVGQPQATAFAFLTNQLPAWYAHVQAQGVPIKYSYKPKEGGPHDGFVAIDPGGYLLEFEEFKQHPENELFMATLETASRITTSIDALNFYGSITWTYHNDLLKMQKFYEEVLGYRMVADQGWTKVYQTSSTGFIGLVDERRGMMDYAEEKAVEIEWRIEDLNAANGYFASSSYWSEEREALRGPEKYLYRLR